MTIVGAERTEIESSETTERTYTEGGSSVDGVAALRGVRSERAGD